MYISYDKLTKKAKCWVYITNKPMLSNRSLVKEEVKSKSSSQTPVRRMMKTTDFEQRYGIEIT